MSPRESVEVVGGIAPLVDIINRSDVATEKAVLDGLEARPALVITVCDVAHEEGVAEPGWLHWSIPDPVPIGTPAAFDAALAELRDRISDLVATPRAA